MDLGHRRESLHRAAPKFSRPAAGARFALALSVPIFFALGSGAASAEENRYNVHLELGPLFNLTQPFLPGDFAAVKTAGAHIRLAFELELHERFGIELGLDPNILSESHNQSIIGQYNVLLGARVRPWYNKNGGYVLPPRRDDPRNPHVFSALDIFSDVWIDAHFVTSVSEKLRLGYDVGVGSRIAFVSPLQVGLFVRFMQLFAAGESGYSQLMLGFTFSLGFNAVHPGKDSDGDGVPDSRDHCPGTAPGAQVLENGCPEVNRSSPAPVCSDTDLDGVCDGRDECPDTPLHTEVNKKGCPAEPPPPPADSAAPSGETPAPSGDASPPPAENAPLPAQ